MDLTDQMNSIERCSLRATAHFHITSYTFSVVKCTISMYDESCTSWPLLLSIAHCGYNLWSPNRHTCILFGLSIMSPFGWIRTLVTKKAPKWPVSPKRFQASGPINVHGLAAANYQTCSTVPRAV